MTETHVVSALRSKRAQISGQMREMGYEMPLLDWFSPATVPRQGGILILVAGTVNAPIPVLIDDAHSLNAAFHQYGAEAERRGATLLFVLAEPKAEVRAEIAADLRGAYHNPAAQKG